MAETFKSSEEYIFKAEFNDDIGLMFFPTGEEVVRCKDCTYWEQAKPDSGSCNRAFEITAYANDFCSYGERKDEVGE